VVEGDLVLDVSPALQLIENEGWPPVPGDPLILQLESVRNAVDSLRVSAPAYELSAVTLHALVTRPTKLIGAPVNYQAHIDEAHADQQISFGKESPPIAKIGLFLKANSCLVGPAEGVTIGFEGRRVDHEMELGVIIGRTARQVLRADALDYVAGYTLALDMTLRGEEDRTFRKSPDSYGVIGPWMVTADELPDPSGLDLSLSVNGELRQASNTRLMIFDVPRLIELASSFYTLHPGDIIMTGTPEGVGPVAPGDVMRCEIDGIGAMDVRVF
jgi:2-keto-4-pentenoate hydratase/2-oxohepta-3-ene-1,7-dioic acid hydratase in catechol pathway